VAPSDILILIPGACQDISSQDEAECVDQVKYIERKKISWIVFVGPI
jgi:hypothetical protein